MSLENRKIADPNMSVCVIYDRVRDLVDEIDRDQFDATMESMGDDEEEVEKFFTDIVVGYINDHVAPEGYALTPHAVTGDIGFWEFNAETECYDLYYPDIPEKYLEEEEEYDDADIREESARRNPVLDSTRAPGVEAEIEDNPGEGVAEVLDEDGQVVGHAPYRTGTPDADPGGVAEEKEAENIAASG